MLKENLGFHFPKIQNKIVLRLMSKRVFTTSDHKPQPRIASTIETMVEKMNRYKLNGIQEGNQLICTYETRNHPLSTAVLEALIANYLL